MPKPPMDVLLQQAHGAEMEIEAVASKIANSDDSTTYPSDYAAMRSEQEHNRQRVLKCMTSMNRLTEKTEPFLADERSEQEQADYRDGFKAAGRGEEIDGTQSLAWQRGWSEAS